MSESIPVITLKELAQEARRLAQEFPNTMASCTYVRYEDDELVPSCIVGKALANLGIPLAILEERNACGIGWLAGMDDDWRAVEWLDTAIEGSDVYGTWLTSLQGRQDGGNTWGEALAYADRRIVMREFGI